ncbi:MAG: Yip1 family protein [Verrucomicrobia bacterium]|nr:Yip1 family protein [Verrucomicrobiota bacterium]
MTDDNSSQPGGTAPENTPSSSASDTLDFPAIFTAAKELLLKPLTAVETVRAIAKDPGGYFSSRKDGSINDSLGFFLVTTAVLVVFAWLQSIFTLNIVGFVLALPFVLFFAILKLAIGTAILFVIAKFLAKGEGTFWESAKIVCRLSWVFLISAFPLWAFFPGILVAIIMIAVYLLWAYLAIPSVAVKYRITGGKHAIPIWAVSGVICLIVLIGAFTGKAIEKGAEQAEALQREAWANVEAMQKEAMDNYNEAQAKANAQAEMARRIEEQKNAATAAAAAAGEVSPDK